MIYMDWKGFFGLGFHQIDFTPKYYPPERDIETNSIGTWSKEFISIHIHHITSDSIKWFSPHAMKYLHKE